MTLTKRQAEQVIKQGRFKKEAIIKILRDMDFQVFDAVDPKRPFDTELIIFNSNGTATRIIRDGAIGLTVRIDKMDAETYFGEK